MLLPRTETPARLGVILPMPDAEAVVEALRVSVSKWALGFQGCEAVTV